MKQKTQTLPSEKEAALERIAQLEQELAEQEAANQRQEEEIQNLLMRISQLEAELDQAQTSLALAKRALLLEVNLEFKKLNINHCFKA